MKTHGEDEELSFSTWRQYNADNGVSREARPGSPSNLRQPFGSSGFRYTRNGIWPDVWGNGGCILVVPLEGKGSHCARAF